MRGKTLSSEKNIRGNEFWFNLIEIKLQEKANLLIIHTFVICTKTKHLIGYNDSNKFNNITATDPILSVTTAIGGVDIGVQNHKFGVQKQPKDYRTSMWSGQREKSQAIQNV